MILAPERLRALLGAYPPERQHALAVFQDIQKDCGYLPQQHIVEAAQYLQMPLSQAYAMATFYHAFSLTPRGKHIIKVCDGTACHIKGSASVLATLREQLGIDLGGTDPDGLFTIEQVACLGACALAPAMQIGEEFYGLLDEEKTAAVIAALRVAEAEEAAEVAAPAGTAGAPEPGAAGVPAGASAAPGEAAS